MTAHLLLAADNPEENPWAIGIRTFLDWMNGKIPGFPLILLAVLVLAIAIVAYHWIKKARVDADSLNRADAAEKVLTLANAEVERLRLILQVIAVSLARRDSIDHGPPSDRPQTIPADGLRNLCEWIVKVLAIEKADVNKMTVWVPTNDGKRLKVAEFHGMGPETARVLEFDILPTTDKKGSFAAMAFRNGKIEICPDTLTDPRYQSVDGHPPSHPYRSIIAVPIRNGRAIVGVYTIDSKEPGRFSEKDPAALQQYDLYARLFGLFVESADSAAPGRVTLEEIIQSQQQQSQTNIPSEGENA